MCEDGFVVAIVEAEEETVEGQRFAPAKPTEKSMSGFKFVSLTHGI